jgi:hypothetical protein
MGQGKHHAMIGWLLIFAGGVLGSAHCVGMCGGFVIALGAAGQGHAANLLRQLTYGLGRVFTYSFFGITAGFLSSSVQSPWRPWMNVQATLSIVAGVSLLLLGLHANGLIRWPRTPSSAAPCFGATFFGALLRTTRLRSVFLAGMVNGFLPCGLVYAFLALAASSGNLWRGSATMFLFGLGTIPVMMIVGASGMLLHSALRQRLFGIAGICVAVTGVLSIVRGLGFVQVSGLFDAPGCPLCR